MPCQRVRSRAAAVQSVNSQRSWQVSHILRDLVHTRLVNEQAIAVTLRNNYAPIKVMPHYPPSGHMRGHLIAIEPKQRPGEWGH